MMRIAPFPKTTSWFARSLGDEGKAEVLAAEPKAATLTGIANPSGSLFTARIDYAGGSVSGKANTALRAFHQAQAKLAEVAA